MHFWMFSADGKMSISGRILFLELLQRWFAQKHRLRCLFISHALFRGLFKRGSILNRFWDRNLLPRVIYILMLAIIRFELERVLLLFQSILTEFLFIIVAIITDILHFLLHLCLLVVVFFKLFLFVFKVHIGVIISFQVYILENTTVYVLNYVDINFLRELAAVICLMYFMLTANQFSI